MSRKLLLTGRPGVGKSTIIRNVLRELARLTSPPAIGGFITDEIRERQHRLGFRVTAIDTGATAELARFGLESPFRVGHYGVALAAMEEVAIPALRRAQAAAELIVVDEIGRMECFAPDFLVEVIACLAGPRPVLGVLSEHRLPFLDALRDREDVELVPVTDRNRGVLTESLVARLLARLPDSRA